MHAGAVEKCLRPRALLRKFSLVEHVFCLKTDRLATFNVASLEIVRTQLDIHYDLESFGAAYVGLEAALAEAQTACSLSDGLDRRSTRILWLCEANRAPFFVNSISSAAHYDVKGLAARGIQMHFLMGHLPAVAFV